MHRGYEKPYGAGTALRIMMKLHTSKQLKRMENRKKKIVAFLEVAKLNDQDRENKTKMNSHQKNDAVQLDGYTDRKADEPCPKRQKTNDGTSSSQYLRQSRHPRQSTLLFPKNQQTPTKPSQEPGMFGFCESFPCVNNPTSPPAAVSSQDFSFSFQTNHFNNGTQNQSQSSMLLNPQNVNLLRNQAYINLIWNYILKHNQMCLPLPYLHQQPLAGYPNYISSINSGLVDVPLPTKVALNSGRENYKPSNSVEENQPNEEGKKQAPLAEEDLAELRKKLKERFNSIKKMPLFRLKESGETASFVTPEDRRVPLFFADIQHLIMFGILAVNSPFQPSRWCHFARSGHLSAFNVMFIEGISIRDYVRFSEELDALSSSNFQHRVEVVMPSAYGGSLAEELVAVPLSVIQHNNLLKSYGTLDAAMKESGEVFRVLRAIFPIHHKPISTESSKALQKLEPESDVLLPPSDKFSRTRLLLSAWQMIEENYPMPMNNSLREKYSSFVRTKDIYTEVSPFSPMYGLDCEMCITSIGQSELARVSIVNEKFEEVLDTLVLPYNKITNYVTAFSGITKELMKGVTTRIEDVQKFIREKLEPDAILVGQSLNFDLVALKMMHPYCIDTSVIFNITGDRYRKSKLRDLARQFLHETIQTGNKGHCSVEDSSACVRLVQLKLQKGIEFGDAVLSSLFLKQDERKQSNQSITNKQTINSKQSGKKPSEDVKGYATSLFSFAARGNKTTTFVGTPSVIEDYVDFLNPKTTSFAQVDGIPASDVTTNNQPESTSQTKPVSCVITSSNEVTAEEAAKRSSSNSNTIAQIRLSDQEKENLTQGKADGLKRVNEWIKKMYDGTPENGMCIVVLCGRDTSSNGACFVHLRTSEIKDFHFEPKFSPPVIS